MQPKMPIWMYIVFGAEILAALAFAAFGWILSQMFAPSPLDFKLAAMLFGPILITLVFGWFARAAWQAGQHSKAQALIFGPAACWILFSILAQIFVGR